MNARVRAKPAIGDSASAHRKWHVAPAQEAAATGAPSNPNVWAGAINLPGFLAASTSSATSPTIIINLPSSTGESSSSSRGSRGSPPRAPIANMTSTRYKWFEVINQIKLVALKSRRHVNPKDIFLYSITYLGTY